MSSSTPHTRSWQATALYDFHSPSYESLSIRAHEDISILQRLGHGWLLGTNTSGAVGRLPAAIVKPKAHHYIPENSPQRRISESRSRSISPSSIFSEGFRTARPNSPADSGLSNGVHDGTQSGIAAIRTSPDNIGVTGPPVNTAPNTGEIKVDVSQATETCGENIRLFPNDFPEIPAGLTTAEEGLYTCEEDAQDACVGSTTPDQDQHTTATLPGRLPSYDEVFSALEHQEHERDTLYRAPSIIITPQLPQNNTYADQVALSAPIPAADRRTTTSNSIVASDSVADVPLSEAPCGMCLETDPGNAYCNGCNATFCCRCWDKQFKHQKEGHNSRDIPHEKTSLSLAEKVRSVLQKAADEHEPEEVFQRDAETVWFGKFPFSVIPS